MTKLALNMGFAVLLATSVILLSCSSSPDEAQLRQLNDLKEEYAALQKEVASKDQEKGVLVREIAEKNATLKKCSDDQRVVKQRLGR